MSRRVCLMAVANGFIPSVVANLPPNVAVAARQEHFDRAITNLRLEGDGLPEWCDEPAHGEPYAWAAAIFGGDGILRICPVHPIEPPFLPPGKSMFERLQEQYRHPN